MAYLYLIEAKLFIDKHIDATHNILYIHNFISSDDSVVTVATLDQKVTTVVMVNAMTTVVTVAPAPTALMLTWSQFI